MKKKILSLTLFLVLTFAFTVMSKSDAYAAVDQSTILKKWDFTQYYMCAQNAANTPIQTKTTNKKIVNDVFKADHDYYLPSYAFQHSVGNGNTPQTNCLKFLIGDGSKLKGALDFYSGGANIKNATWDHPDDAKNALTDLGYKLQATNGAQNFIIKYLSKSVTTTVNPYNIFNPYDVKDNGTKEGDSAVVTITPNSDGTMYYSYSFWDNLGEALSIKIAGGKFTLKLAGGIGCTLSDTSSVTVNLENDVNVFYDNLSAALQGKTWKIQCQYVSTSGVTTTIDSEYVFSVESEGIIESSDAGEYTYTDRPTTAASVIQKMSGMDLNGLQLTDSERYTLYYYYLDKFLPKSTQDRMTCEPSGSDPDSYLQQVKLKDTDGTFKTCYVNLNGVDPAATEVTTQLWSPNTPGYPYITTITMDKVIDWFNGLTDEQTAAMDDVDPLNPSGITIDDDGNIDDPDLPQPNSDTDVNSCQKQGGFLSMGWIFCEILQLTGRAVNGIYNNILVPQLQVEPQLFTGVNGANPTEQAWNIFRNIANTAFVIALLVIIFSQLTGVGIDNYGIKRTLPKLIIAAILVNLSYIMCQLAVDLSNILGNGLQSLLQGLPTGDGDSILGAIAGSVDATKYEIDTGSTIAAVTLVAALAGGAFAIWAQPAIVISILVSAIGAVVAIVFLFILLAARQAALVVLVVISPVALVCYMLPNTKKLFDKWLKLGSDLLVVYPICGLLIGGGNYISKLLLAVNGNTWMSAVVAVIVGIIPLFFIPTVLRNAFSTMGSMGAKITGFGQRMGNRLTKMAGNSAGVQDLQRRGLERRTRIRAGVDKDGNARNLNAFGRFIRGGKRSVAANRAQYLKDQDAINRANRLAGAGGVGFEAARVAQTKGAEKEEMADYMTLINAQTNNGEDTATFDNLVAQYANDNNKFGLLAAARIAGRRKDTATDFMGKYMNVNYRDKDGRVVNSPFAVQNAALRASLAKELATGENSGTYMGAAPLAFEYAAQMNKGVANGGISADTSYEDWLKQTNDNGEYGNVHRALDNYVNNSQQLLGMKGSSLTELANMMQDPNMSDKDRAKVRQLARETIANHEKHGGAWEADKVKQIADLANGKGTIGGDGVEYRYNSVTNSIDVIGASGNGNGNGNGSGGSNNGNMQDGQVIQTRDSGNGGDAGASSGAGATGGASGTQAGTTNPEPPIVTGTHAPSNNGGGGGTVVVAGGADNSAPRMNSNTFYTGSNAPTGSGQNFGTVEQRESGLLISTSAGGGPRPIVGQSQPTPADNSQQVRVTTPRQEAPRSQNRTNLVNAARNGQVRTRTADGRTTTVRPVNNPNRSGQA